MDLSFLKARSIHSIEKALADMLCEMFGEHLLNLTDILFSTREFVSSSSQRNSSRSWFMAATSTAVEEHWMVREA